MIPYNTFFLENLLILIELMITGVDDEQLIQKNIFPLIVIEFENPRVLASAIGFKIKSKNDWHL